MYLCILKMDLLIVEKHEQKEKKLHPLLNKI